LFWSILALAQIVDEVIRKVDEQIVDLMNEGDIPDYLPLL